MKQQHRIRISKPVIGLILINAVFIGVHVQQYISFFRASCAKQTHERELSDLQARYQLVIQEFEAVQDRRAIQEYAQSIGLQKIKLKQVRNLASHKENKDLKAQG